MGKLIGLLLALLLIGVGLVVLLGGDSEKEVDRRVAEAEAAENDIARQKADEAAAAQVALNAAVVASLLQAFDDSEIARRHAIKKTRQDLKSIRINTGLLARREAPRLANRLTHPTMLPRLGFAYGMDLIAYENRVWTLFDEALGPGMANIIDNDADSYSKQLTHHQHDLINSQARFGAKLNHAIKPLAPVASVSVPRLSDSNFNSAHRSGVQRRVLASIWSRLRTRYPAMLRRGAKKLGIKEAKRATVAAIDGPVPIIETGLILWGLYDVLGSAASAWRAAQTQITAAAIAEADGLAQRQLQAAAQQLFVAEQAGRGARCVALAAALKPLAGHSIQEYERRCA